MPASHSRRTLLLAALATASAAPVLASCDRSPKRRTLDTSLAYVPLSGAPEGAPVIEVFSDFRCPYCAAFAKASAPDLRRLADEKKIALRWAQRPMLDIARGEGVHFSRDSANAFYACWEQGDDLAWDFHDAMFAAQAKSIDDPDPSKADIEKIAKRVGADEKTLEQIKSGAFDDWIMKTVEPAARKLKIGTPTIVRDGKVLDVDTDDPKAVLKAVTAS